MCAYCVIMNSAYDFHWVLVLYLPQCRVIHHIASNLWILLSFYVFRVICWAYINSFEYANKIHFSLSTNGVSRRKGRWRDMTWKGLAAFHAHFTYFSFIRYILIILNVLAVRLTLLFQKTDSLTFSVYNCTFRALHFHRLMECVPQLCLSTTC